MNIDRINLIEFELAVMDFIENSKTHTKDELEWLSCTLHEHVETACQDWAMDVGIDDYEPQY